MAVSLLRQLQLRRDDDDDDDNDHDGDDEQDYDRDDDYDDPEHSRSRSRSHSPVPPQAPTPPAAQQQQQQQPPLRQQQPQPTPTPSPFGAHVHFHSRVRITSGLRHSRGNTSIGGDSSDSDSPSSSISAPLRYRSHDTVPRLPLGERVSRLASRALQKRRMTAAAVASSPASRRLRATNHEYTPFLRAGVPVTYGAAQRGDPSEDRSQVDGLHGEDAVAFGRWPWRALNRQVSSGSLFVQKRSVRLWSFCPVVEVAARINIALLLF